MKAAALILGYVLLSSLASLGINYLFGGVVQWLFTPVWFLGGLYVGHVAYRIARP